MVNTIELPLYVILKPHADGTVEVVGRYGESKINNEAAFMQFLKQPLQGGGTQSAQVRTGSKNG